MTLKEWIKREGLTKDEAAYVLDVPVRTLRGWLYQKRTPPADKILDINVKTGGAVRLEDWVRK